MKAFNLDPEIIAFIDSYIEVSSLSTATSVARQRIDYAAMVTHFRYPHLQGHQFPRQLTPSSRGLTANHPCHPAA